MNVSKPGAILMPLGYFPAICQVANLIKLAKESQINIKFVY